MGTEDPKNTQDMQETARASARRPLFAVVPGIGIGPFRLGMTAEEIASLCDQFLLRNESAIDTGLYVEFHEGRAVQIQMAVGVGLSLAGEPVTDHSNENVRRLLSKIAPPKPHWTEMDGLVVLHWEYDSDPVFAFEVYAPGHRN